MIVSDYLNGIRACTNLPTTVLVTVEKAAMQHADNFEKASALVSSSCIRAAAQDRRRGGRGRSVSSLSSNGGGRNGNQCGKGKSRGNSNRRDDHETREPFWGKKMSEAELAAHHDFALTPEELKMVNKARANRKKSGKKTNKRNASKVQATQEETPERNGSDSEESGMQENMRPAKKSKKK